MNEINNGQLQVETGIKESTNQAVFGTIKPAEKLFRCEP